VDENDQPWQGELEMLQNILWGLAVILPAALAPAPEKTKEKPKSDPPGAVVEARLVAKKDSYTLELGGKTAEEFRTQLKDAETTGAYPPAPKLELMLEFTNTSDKEVQIQVGGTRNVLTLDLKGTGAETVVMKNRATPKFILLSKTLTLAPGKSESVPINSLAFGMRNLTHAAYWTAPGEYTLSASYQTALAPAPNGARDMGNGFGAVTLTTAPITIKVEAK
jgi:hypothetical protein